MPREYLRGQPTFFEKDFYSLNELHNFKALSDSFGVCPFFYCDLPKMLPDDLPKFLDIFTKHSARGFRTAPCFEEPWSKESHPFASNSSWHNPLWQVLDMYLDDDLPQGFGHEIIASNYKDLSKEFPYFYQQIFEYFPFKKIWFIKFLQNNREILPHRDTDWNFNLPTSFRSMIYDENVEPTFYLRSFGNWQEKYVDLPCTVNTFAYNNGNFLHGARYHQRPKILMVVRGYLDFEKYRVILENSAKKFSLENINNETIHCP